MLLRGACKLLGSRETIGLTKMVTRVWDCYWVGQWGGENGSRGAQRFRLGGWAMFIESPCGEDLLKDPRIGAGSSFRHCETENAGKGKSSRGGRHAYEDGNCWCECDLRPRSPKARDRGHPQLSGIRFETRATRHGIFLTHGYGSLTGAGAELLPDCRASETFAGRFAAAAAIPAALF